jgi:3',5'-cyclic AMP phosphodiesterase CpdA
MKRNALTVMSLVAIMGWNAVASGMDSKADRLPPLQDGAFTYAVIPDTQDYDGEGRHTKRGRKPGVGPTCNQKFDAIVDWLVANKEKENILFVSHTGDITDMNNDHQWRFASNAMSKLDGKLPYAISPGNHDMKLNGDTSFFQRYFPASRFEGNPWYAATFPGYTNSIGLFVSGNNANTICLFGQGSEKFVVVTLECNAPDTVLSWAAKELEKYGDRRVIVSTHQDIGAIEKKNGRRIYNDLKVLSAEERAKYNPDLSMLGRMEWHKCHGKEGNSGKAIWEKFTSRLKNAFLVVSGDQGMIKITRVDGKGVHGNKVYSLMQDTGAGYIRIFRFVPSEKKIFGYTVDPKNDGKLVHSYGAWHDSKWFNFELPYPDAPVVASASDALIAMRKVDWKGVPNARDLGGLPGRNGRYVRRGRIYRTAGLNDNAKYRYPGTKKEMPRKRWKGPGKSRITPPVRELIVEKLGVKTDLDLRNDGETFKMTGSPLGDKVKWVRITSSNYAGLGEPKGRDAFVKCFKVFLDEANYPIVFHCIAGADRTGTLACILNGLLGVEEDLLYRDWRYTWTGRDDPKPVPEDRWKRLMGVFSKYEGSTLNERIEKFVLSNGFTIEDIEKFRSLMLK